VDDLQPSAIFAPGPHGEANPGKNAPKSTQSCQLPCRFARAEPDGLALIVRPHRDTHASAAINAFDRPPIHPRGQPNSPSHGRTNAFHASNLAATKCLDFVRKCSRNDHAREFFRLKF
jgi:hypothetical protein